MREKYLTLFLLQVGGGGDHLTVPGQDTCHGAVTLHPGTGHVTYATCAVDRPGHVPMSGAGGQVVLQKVSSEANPNVRNHGEGPY